MWTLTSLALLGVSLIAIVGLQVLRRGDERRDALAWGRLAKVALTKPRTFEPGTVEGLPEPARRYFLYAIAPGTALKPVVELDIAGEIALGGKDDPRYADMRAEQILAAPHGFVWRPRAKRGWMRLSGSDGFENGQGWTRFWLWGLLPVVRQTGNEDHARSAAARGVAEAVFWCPAALLPGPGVAWEAVNADTARVTVEHAGEQHAVDVTVAEDGRPVSVVLQRWSRENPEREWRYQPFGGTIEEVGEFDGFRIATRVEGGNLFGTPGYFPFYKATVDAARFL